MFSLFETVNSITPFEDFASSVIKGTMDELHSTSIFSQNIFPKVNIVDEKDSFIIEAELAGWNKEDITVKIKNGQLILTGQTSTKVENPNNKKFIIRELKRSKFQRSFLLGENLNHENISAEFSNGLLKIVVPKSTVQDKPKVVTIK